MRIFTLQKICVTSCCKGIFAKIVQPQQCCKADATHTTSNGTFLCIETIRKDPLVTCQMQSFVFIGIIGFLKNSHIIRPALVKILIFIRVHRIHFQTDDLEVFSSGLAGFPDVFHVGFCTAFSRKYQDLLQASLSDSFHFPLDLFFVETCAPDFIMAVESTINAVVLAVVGNVDRCEHTHAVTEIFLFFLLRFLRHFL